MKNQFEIFNPSIYGEKITKVSGYPIKFDKFPDDFFVAKVDKYWGVYEVRSGMRVAKPEKTKKQAILTAEESLECISPERMKSAIEEVEKEFHKIKNSL